VEATWKQNPQQTFAAVICDAAGSEEGRQENLWDIEDDELVQGLMAFRQALREVSEQGDSEDIRRIVLGCVQKIWSLHPDWRLGQTLCNLAHHLQEEQREIRSMADTEVVSAVREHFKYRVE